MLTICKVNEICQLLILHENGSIFLSKVKIIHFCFPEIKYLRKSAFWDHKLPICDCYHNEILSTHASLIEN